MENNEYLKFDWESHLRGLTELEYEQLIEESIGIAIELLKEKQLTV